MFPDSLSASCAANNRQKLPCRAFPLAVMSLLLALNVIPSPASATTATVTVDGNGASRTFYGIGMVNSSGTSKLLIDYPPRQQSDILDFLFKPKFGASLQLVKNEIGADNNTSSGTEPSHWRDPAEPPVARGVNFWIASEAKRRNADMQFAALRWANPAWVNTDELTSQYLIKYLDLMAANGTPVDYIGPGINEGDYTPSLGSVIKNTFKPALDAGGYTSKIVIADDVRKKWGAAHAINSDPELAAAVFAQASHYTDGSTPAAQRSGMPLFNSESDSPMMYWGRGIWVARRIATALSTGKQSMWLYQPALDCVYGNIRYQHKGILTANTPWSGHYEIHPSLWLTAQFTQFADVGWKILESGSGALDKNNAYVTFKDPDSGHYSIVIVNGGSHDVTYTFTTSNLSKSRLNVWASDQHAQFIEKEPVTPNDGSFAVTVPAQSVYSLTTTTGQQKGRPSHPIPADTNMSLPYTDDLGSYSVGDQAAYFHDQNGAFEVVEDGAGGQALKQVITTVPARWWKGNNQPPFTVMGGVNLANYQASAKVKIPDASSYAAVFARTTLMDSMAAPKTQPEGYSLWLGGDGSWALRKSTGGATAVLASGTLADYDNNRWHHVQISVNGTTILGQVDGTLVGTVQDDTFSSGNVALATDTTKTIWSNVMFKDLKIEPVDAGVVAFVEQVDDRNLDVFSYSVGDWSSPIDAHTYTNYMDFKRSRTTSSTVGATLDIPFHGTQFSLIGMKSKSGGAAEVYIDGELKKRIDTASSVNKYRNVLYSVYGLSPGPHVFRLVVQSGDITVDRAEAQSFDAEEVQPDARQR